MKNNKKAFTMIELIFVIVVLGILAAIAIPKFAVTRNDALIAKARADIASIRSAIVSERQSRLIRGDSDWISALSTGSTHLFTGNGTGTLLMYGIPVGTSSAGWTEDSGTHTFAVGGNSADFNYSTTTGFFNCTSNAGTDLCALLTL